MFIVYGTRLFGKIQACGETYVATKFFHVSWLPLIPIGTQQILETQPGGPYRFTARSLSGWSVLAAYARTWGLLATIYVVATGITGFVDAMDWSDHTGMVMAPLKVFIAVALLGAAYMQLGRLSEEQKAQQFIYADYVGYPIDVAQFAGRDEVKRAVTEVLAKKAQSLGLFGYRNEMPSRPDYLSLALQPAVNDLEFLNAALTLGRIEWAEAKGDSRKVAGETHAAIWARIRERAEARAEAAQAASPAA